MARGPRDNHKGRKVKKALYLARSATLTAMMEKGAIKEPFTRHTLVDKDAQMFPPNEVDGYLDDAKSKGFLRQVNTGSPRQFVRVLDGVSRLPASLREYAHKSKWGEAVRAMKSTEERGILPLLAIELAFEHLTGIMMEAEHLHEIIRIYTIEGILEQSGPDYTLTAEALIKYCAAPQSDDGDGEDDTDDDESDDDTGEKPGGADDDSADGENDAADGEDDDNTPSAAEQSMRQPAKGRVVITRSVRGVTPRLLNRFFILLQKKGWEEFKTDGQRNGPDIGYKGQGDFNQAVKGMVDKGGLMIRGRKGRVRFNYGLICKLLPEWLESEAPAEQKVVPTAAPQPATAAAPVDRAEAPSAPTEPPKAEPAAVAGNGVQLLSQALAALFDEQIAKLPLDEILRRKGVAMPVPSAPAEPEPVPSAPVPLCHCGRRDVNSGLCEVHLFAAVFGLNPEHVEAMMRGKQYEPSPKLVAEE